MTYTSPPTCLNIGSSGAITVGACPTSTTLTWNPKSDGTIHSALDDALAVYGVTPQCLTANAAPPFFADASQPLLSLTPCTGSAAQKWALAPNQRDCDQTSSVVANMLPNHQMVVTFQTSAPRIMELRAFGTAVVDKAPTTNHSFTLSNIVVSASQSNPYTIRGCSDQVYQGAFTELANCGDFGDSCCTVAGQSVCSTGQVCGGYTADVCTPPNYTPPPPPPPPCGNGGEPCCATSMPGFGGYQCCLQIGGSYECVDYSVVCNGSPPPPPPPANCGGNGQTCCASPNAPCGGDPTLFCCSLNDQCEPEGSCAN